MSLTPYITPRRCADAIAWYVEVLGAVEVGERYVDPDGRVGHAELSWDSGDVLMLSDAYPDFGAVAPPEGASASSFALHLDVPDVDATLAAARAAGAEVHRPAEDQPDGERRGSFVDPFGVRWMVSTTVREVSQEELSAVVAEFARTGADTGPVG
jgi:uncharacterized glyoxalase superfamily protein PhnB